jgi:MarR family transcriptional regulator, organic hydroperoxide resistance regulator
MSSRPINEYLVYLLAQADHYVSRQLEARFRAAGIALEQWRVLKLLCDSDGRSMGDLAAAGLMNHPTLTKTIDRMVSDALVYRRADDLDRRRVLIFISEHGRALTDRLNRMASRQQDEIVESCGDDQAIQLKRLLEGLIVRIS